MARPPAQSPAETSLPRHCSAVVRMPESMRQLALQEAGPQCPLARRSAGSLAQAPRQDDDLRSPVLRAMWTPRRKTRRAF